MGKRRIFLPDAVICRCKCGCGGTGKDPNRRFLCLNCWLLYILGWQEHGPGEADSTGLDVSAPV